MLARSGDLTSSWELARQYGFTDADGERPDWGRHFQKIIPSIGFINEGLRRQIAWLDRLSLRAKQYVGEK